MTTSHRREPAEDTATPRSTPNTPLGVALVGYGYWGTNLARNIVAVPDLRLVGIADAESAQRARAKAAYPSVEIWDGLDDVLNDEHVEAVVIAAPAALHAAMATECLRSGRHVLVEKPLATNRRDAEAVTELAATAGRVLMVGHTFLYSAPVRRLQELIRSGELGKVQYVYSQRLSLGRIRRDCNALWNFAPHDVAILSFVLGEKPIEVSATSVTVIDPAVPDVFFTSLRYRSGIGAHLHVSWIDPRKTRLMTVVGDEKMVIYNDVSVDQKLWIVDAGVARNPDLGGFESLGEFQWRTRAGDIVIPKIDMTEPLREEMSAFAAACRSGEPPVSDGRHGLEVVTVLEAADRSAKNRGVPVEIDW
ncbi:MAG: Gfo/Idh/MocA family oxidoreductase [Acidimicrobiales bacterium]|nr:Gfo/Idh/MocA family oxidoreductase [Acidimicrobiales bacterium]